MPPSSTDDLDESCLAAFIEAAAAFERLPVDPGWQPVVAAHFKALHAAARLVMAAPIDDLIESAAIFTP